MFRLSSPVLGVCACQDGGGKKIIVFFLFKIKLKDILMFRFHCARFVIRDVKHVKILRLSAYLVIILYFVQVPPVIVLLEINYSYFYKNF